MAYITQRLIIILAAVVSVLLGGSWKTVSIVLSICIIILLMYGIFTSYQKKKRINALTLYLTKLQDNVILPDFSECQEDAPGILQSVIYKLVALLKEQSDQENQQKRYLSDMLSDISYQLKTPLTGITIITDLLKNQNLPHIFECFHKGKHSSKDSIGIGLAMAKLRLVAFAGKVQLRNPEELVKS